MGRDHGLGADGSDVVAEVIGVIGGVAHHPVGREAGDQAVGLSYVVALACGEEEADRQAEPAHGRVDLAGQAASGTADRLILSRPFAPAACWWARTMVESTIRYSKSGSSDWAAKMRCHTPPVLQRRNR